MTLELKKKARSAEGWTEFYQHASEACGGPMSFSVYRPPQAESGPVPVLYWLSGLTCTEENFMAKSGIQRLAAEAGLLVVAPDTSPRDTGLDGATEDWAFGEGAGYYLNATQSPWDARFQMYDYVTSELPSLIEKEFPVQGDRQSISGHSMGGHGALTIALKNPGRYRSVSAFAPIVAPTQCPWGKNAFTQFLGRDTSTWDAYDACELMKAADHRFPLLVDQGSADGFLEEQLLTPRLEAVAKETDFPLTLNYREGYDHSYYFVLTFLPNHIEFHRSALTP